MQVQLVIFVLVVGIVAILVVQFVCMLLHRLEMFQLVLFNTSLRTAPSLVSFLRPNVVEGKFIELGTFQKAFDIDLYLGNVFCCP